MLALKSGEAIAAPGFFFWTRLQLRNFSEPVGVRVRTNFVVLYNHPAKFVVYKSCLNSWPVVVHKSEGQSVQILGSKE